MMRFSLLLVLLFASNKGLGFQFSPIVLGHRSVVCRLSDGDDAETLRARAAALREEVAALQAEAEKERSNDIEPSKPKRIVSRPPPQRTPPQKKRNVVTSDVSWSDRALASLPYVLPLSDALPYGKYVFHEFPEVAITVAPFIPFIMLITAIPLGQLICFVALSVASRNPSFSRFSRFSFQQAILMDISLIFPQLLGTIFGITSIKFPTAVVEPASTTIFFFILLSSLYAIVSNFRGQLPNNVPLFSETADRTMGPF